MNKNINKEEIYNKLTQVAADNNIKVKTGKIEHTGGYCKYDGQQYIIINNNLDLEDKIDFLENELKNIVEQ